MSNRTESDQKTQNPRRARAYALLAGGAGVRAVGRELKVKHETIIRWRDSEEGQNEIRRLATKLAGVREGELVAAEKRLARLTHRAVDVFGELLESDDPNVRLRAATAVADRGGLPKTERVEVPEQGYDYSDLTDEELATLRAAQEIRAHALSGGSWLIAWDDAKDAGYGTPEGDLVEGFDAPREWRDRPDVVVFDWRPLDARRRPCAWPVPAASQDAGKGGAS